MKILPITNNSYKAQNPSFNAINQKYYDWGKKEIEERGYITIHFTNRIEEDVLLFKEISFQDGVDTLKSIRELLKPKQNECINELIGEFKQLAKQERIAARKALKK